MENPTITCLLSLLGCGAETTGPTDAGRDAATTDAATIDAATCAPAPATTAPFMRRTDNPRLRAGTRFGADVDTTIADPDLLWDDALGQWRGYFLAARGPSFAGPLTHSIREMRGGTDGATWTLFDPPALLASPSTEAWDHDRTETPTVVVNPDAPPDRRYLMLYAGAAGTMPGQAFPAYAIGAAFSPDGVTFTRVAAADSPHGQAGLVLRGTDVYPRADAALVADPDVVFRDGTYHAWFSSFACAAATTACDTVTAFGVAHASSTDGIHWTPDAASPVPSLVRTPGVPTSGGQQPSVVWDQRHCRYELWLTSDAAGETDVQPAAFNNTMGAWHATSADGATWSIDFDGARDLAWAPGEPGEPLGMLTGVDVAAHGDDRLMLYVGFDDQAVPPDFYLPDRTPTGFRPGVMALGVATRGP
ncbi:MAG: hypothetical protein R3B06_05515 [Kofleriaceae bacterium]